MDFQPTPSEGHFREEIRDVLKRILPSDMAWRGQQGYLAGDDDSLRWTHILHEEKGWSVAHWPTAYGGPDWTPMERYIFEEECYLAGAPLPNLQGVTLVGPVIYTFGNEEQKQRFLPAIREGRIYWTQGFSEPGAGSDLASLRTSAVRDGDAYIVNGQKIWTSNAIWGDWCFLLVRTDPAAKAQKGISFLLVDMKTPGVTVRPIQSLEGSHHLAEVFYDNVRVPAENLIGEVNKGWNYTKFLLFNERAFLGAEAPALKRYLKKIKTCASIERAAGRPLIRDPVFASRLAELELEVNAIDMSVKRVLVQGIGERNGGMAIGSVLKARGSELHQRLTEMLLETIGDYGPVFYPDPNEDHALRAKSFVGPDYAPGLAAEVFYRRASTIFGGTAEIQRGIIAKMMFGF